MTAFLTYLLLWVWHNLSWASWQWSANIKTEIKVAYEAKDYPKAIELYQRYFITPARVSPEARLNLGHLFFEIGDLDKAKENYTLAGRGSNLRLRSYAMMQLALVAVQERDTARALELLRGALRIIPTNQEARANYEIISYQFSGEITGPREKLSKAEQPAPAPPPRTPELSTEEDERREQLLKRLRDLTMTEEEARALLETMKEQEKDYIYQLKQNRYGADQPKAKHAEW